MRQWVRARTIRFAMRRCRLAPRRAPFRRQARKGWNALRHDAPAETQVFIRLDGTNQSCQIDHGQAGSAKKPARAPDISRTAWFAAPCRSTKRSRRLDEMALFRTGGPASACRRSGEPQRLEPPVQRAFAQPQLPRQLLACAARGGEQLTDGGVLDVAATAHPLRGRRRGTRRGRHRHRPAWPAGARRRPRRRRRTTGSAPAHCATHGCCRATHAPATGPWPPDPPPIGAGRCPRAAGTNAPAGGCPTHSGDRNMKTNEGTLDRSLRIVVGLAPIAMSATGVVGMSSATRCRPPPSSATRCSCPTTARRAATSPAATRARSIAPSTGCWACHPRAGATTVSPSRAMPRRR